MRQRNLVHALSSGSLLVIMLAAPRLCWAHIDLIAPEPRAHDLSADPNANIKEGPCGQEQNGRTTTINVFAPGATISVEWRETTNHTSYYRIAFDADGDDDFPIFPGLGTSPIGDDPTRMCPVDGHVILAYELVDGVGGGHTLQVTLPDVACENCTLQLIQYMYDTGRPYYFQCADLALRAENADGGTPDSGSSAAGDAGATEYHAAASCSAPLPPRPRRGADASVEPVPTEEMSGEAPEPRDAGAPLEAPTRGSRKGGGCTLGAGDPRESRRHGAPLTALFAIATLLLWQRSSGPKQRSLRPRARRAT